jgi:hypothetical protein
LMEWNGRRLSCLNAIFISFDFNLPVNFHLSIATREASPTHGASPLTCDSELEFL